jgi:hypothetical protein
MDTVKLGTNLFRVGLGLLVVAIVWWVIAYSDLPPMVGDSMGSFVKCIAGFGLECTMANAITGYTSAPFWIGVLLMIAGYIVGRSAKSTPKS